MFRQFPDVADWPSACLATGMTSTPTNLTMHREGPSVWELQARENMQRRAMGAAGLFMIAAGTLLVARAYQGRLSSVVNGVSGRVTPLLKGPQRDHVNKASNDSFPASDPPSWTAAVGKPSEP